MKDAIVLDNVSKRYGPKEIIHNISFKVGAGEIVGFLGPNGAGKTTTMKMIAGSTAATSGKVEVSGINMATRNYEAAKKIGYLPEQPPLYDILEVSSYLKFVAKTKGINKKNINSELNRVVEACKLESGFNAEIYKLSKGFRQRLGLAQALLGQPKVLLLDEPTAGLDPIQIQETREVIRRFGKQHTVLLSTHILSEVTLICSRVAIINEGRLLAIDSPEGLQKASQQANTVSLITSNKQTSQLKEKLLKIKNILSVEIKKNNKDNKKISVDCYTDDTKNIESEIADIVTSKWDLFYIERKNPTLENIFLQYIKDKK